MGGDRKRGEEREQRRGSEEKRKRKGRGKKRRIKKRKSTNALYQGLKQKGSNGSK